MFWLHILKQKLCYSKQRAPTPSLIKSGKSWYFSNEQKLGLCSKLNMMKSEHTTQLHKKLKITQNLNPAIYWNSSSESNRAFSLFLVFLDLGCCWWSVLSEMSMRAGAGLVGAAASTTPLGTLALPGVPPPPPLTCTQYYISYEGSGQVKLKPWKRIVIPHSTLYRRGQTRR